MIEKALRYELIRAIPELSGEIYPTNAPKSATKPHLVYYRADTDRNKTLDGYTDAKALRFYFSIMAVRYDDMKPIADKVENLLIKMAGLHIGKDMDTYVEDITIHNIEEGFENNLKINRGIIDFTIYI